MTSNYDNDIHKKNNNYNNLYVDNIHNENKQ